MPTTPPLRQARITAIPLSVSKILLLLRNIVYPSTSLQISFCPHQTILFGITTCMLSFVNAGASATDISSSNCLFVPLEASFVIFRDLSLSDSASVLFVLYEIVLFFLWSISHVFHSLSGSDFAKSICGLITIYLSFCKVSLLILYQMLQP